MFARTSASARTLPRAPADAGLGYDTCWTPPVSCPSPPPSWSAQVQGIIERRCALGGECHGEGGAEQGMYDFTSYAGVAQNYMMMQVEVATCNMPPFYGVAPTHDEWTALLSWLQCGAPDN